jgi:hypothetical protein
VPKVTACLLVYIDARHVLEEDADLEVIPESGAVYQKRRLLRRLYHVSRPNML